MRRRRFLARASAFASSALLAGCTDSTDGTDSTTAPPTSTTGTTSTSEKPDGIYIQSFQERMSMQGTASVGDYSVALMFTVPHTFWTLTNWERSVTAKTDADAVHLMAAVWDDETGTVLPDAGLSVELTMDDYVSQEVIYPMLSQPMGFHYGGNFPLGAGDGTYTANVSIGGISARTTGAFEGRFQGAETAEMTVEFTEESRSRVGSSPVDAAGDPGALSPMETSYPKSVAPGPDGLPGTVHGTAAIDDAYFDVVTLDSAERVGKPEAAYLAVSARTRYNDYELSAMGLDATLERDGETVYDGGLARTLSPDLGYHYGAAVPSAEAGDELTLSVRVPPQV
ncbi:MAG: fe2+ transport protein, partial [Halobacterium sp.]